MAAGAPRCVAPIAATLGEGPIWDQARGGLWFVDIKGRRIHRFVPATGSTDSWETPGEVGWVLPERGGGLIAGIQGAISWFDPETGSFETILEIEPERPGNRLNDAATDRQGRLWFGTMDNAEAEPSGRLYRLGRDGALDGGLPPVIITNGPSFSPDGRTLYHTDTLGGLIHAVRVDDRGLLQESSVFARIDPSDGYPDGSTVDSEGCVWTGLFGGWAARRYAPNGELVDTVRFPVANVTKLAFGGPDLRTVYATTARKGLDTAALAAQPEAGSLFAFAAKVAGLQALAIDLKR